MRLLRERRAAVESHAQGRRAEKGATLDAPGPFRGRNYCGIDVGGAWWSARARNGSRRVLSLCRRGYTCEASR